MGKNSISIKGDCNYTLTLFCLPPWAEIVLMWIQVQFSVLLIWLKTVFEKVENFPAVLEVAPGLNSCLDTVAAAPVSWEPPWAITQPWELTLLLCYFNSFVSVVCYFHVCTLWTILILSFVRKMSVTNLVSFFLSLLFKFQFCEFIASFQHISTGCHFSLGLDCCTCMYCVTASRPGCGPSGFRGLDGLLALAGWRLILLSLRCWRIPSP